MFKRATFDERLAAFVLDQLLLVLTIFLSILFFGDKSDQLVFQLSIVGLFVGYNVVFVWLFGATLGKMLLRIKIVDTEYRSVGFWSAFVRESLGKLLSGIFGIGYLWVLVDKKRQGWHDKIAGTYVAKVDFLGKLISGNGDERVSSWRKFLLFFAIFFSLFPFSIYLFVVQPFQLSGKSMIPTYYPNQYFLVEKVSYKFGDPRRGDVIVYELPGQPDRMFFGRVIGLSREKVELKDGHVYINDKLLNESYVVEGMLTRGFGMYMREGEPVVVPGDNYVVMGDNREHSLDSRQWGFLPRKNIVGRLFVCYWNCAK